MAIFPFNKYTTAPTPWGGSPYNVPVELQQSSFMQARTGLTPKFAARVAAFFSTPVPQYFVAPMRVYGAMSKHPGDAMQVMNDAHASLKSLADSALEKHVSGLPLSVDEGRALIAVHMPQVSVPRERCGPGVVPDWDVPFCDRSTVPQPIVDQVNTLMTPAEDQRRLTVGNEIAMIEAIRAQWLRQYPGGGR